jgi:hypothetical protein
MPSFFMCMLYVGLVAEINIYNFRREGAYAYASGLWALGSGLQASSFKLATRSSLEASSCLSLRAACCQLLLLLSPFELNELTAD